MGAVETAGIIEFEEAKAVRGGTEAQGTQRALDCALDEGLRRYLGLRRRRHHGARLGFIRSSAPLVFLAGGELGFSPGQTSESSRDGWIGSVRGDRVGG